MIRLVSDSTANLPADLVAQYNVEVVPLKVQIGSDTFREGEDLSQAEFFDRLPTANPLPTTSQPSPLEFEEVYNKILSSGDEILSLHISSDLSGTYNSARNAAESVEAGDRVSVVDTRSVSAGLALLVVAAGEMVAAGKSRKEIVAAIEELKGKVHLLLTLDTLEYLKRGGRIGGAAAFIGGLLRVKPTIVVQNGKLEAGERARSRRKALDHLVESQVQRFGNQPVWVGSAEAMAEDIDAFEGMLRERLNVQRYFRCQIGPVVATHTGPNTLGVAVIPAPEL